MFKVPEKYRLLTGANASNETFGNNGQFIIRKHMSTKLKSDLLIQASDGAEFEHVSVSKRKGTPTWEEICFVKDLFWSETDLVVQFHPPKSEYVNNHQNCLHLWRKCGTNAFVETPGIELV